MVSALGRAWTRIVRAPISIWLLVAAVLIILALLARRRRRRPYVLLDDDYEESDNPLDKCKSLTSKKKEQLLERMKKLCGQGLQYGQIHKEEPLLQCPDLLGPRVAACEAGIKEAADRKGKSASKGGSCPYGPCPAGEIISQTKPCVSQDGKFCCNGQMKNCIDKNADNLKQYNCKNVPADKKCAPEGGDAGKYCWKGTESYNKNQCCMFPWAGSAGCKPTAGPAPAGDNSSVANNAASVPGGSKAEKLKAAWEAFQKDENKMNDWKSKTTTTSSGCQYRSKIEVDPGQWVCPPDWTNLGQSDQAKITGNHWAQCYETKKKWCAGEYGNLRNKAQPKDKGVLVYHDGTRKEVTDTNWGNLLQLRDKNGGGGIKNVWVPKGYKMCIRNLLDGMDSVETIGSGWTENPPNADVADEAWIIPDNEECARPF